MNLPVINSANFQVFSRNPNARRDFRESWGAKTEGIKSGDYLDGVLLGFETDPKFGSRHIILKSFAHGGAQVLIWGCSAIQNELFSDAAHTIPLYHPGDVIRVTYKGSYIGKKGRAEGKLIAIFTIDEIVGYTMTNVDIQEVRNFQQAQLQAAAPTQRAQIAYQPQAPVYAAIPAAPQQAYAPPVQTTASKVTTHDDNSFDL